MSYPSSPHNYPPSPHVATNYPIHPSRHSVVDDRLSHEYDGSGFREYDGLGFRHPADRLSIPEEYDSPGFVTASYHPTQIAGIKPSGAYVARSEIGGYRIKEEKARRLIAWIEDAFTSKPIPASAPPKVESSGIWTIGDAIARFQKCCNADPHQHERHGLNIEIQELKHRRYIAAQLLEEVEQEISEIQRCLYDRLQRRSGLYGAPRDGRDTQGLDSATLLNGAIETRADLKGKLNTAETAIKRRDDELEKLYAALSGRNINLQKIAKYGDGRMNHGLRPVSVRPLSRVALAFDKSLCKPHLRVALLHWRLMMEDRRFLDRLLLVTTKVLQACQEDAKALPVLEPLLQKLGVLREQSQPAETWDILSVWDWAHGEMAYRTRSGGNSWFSSRPAASPSVLSLQDARRPARGRRPDAIQRQAWVHFLLRVCDRMSLRKTFIGWTWVRVLKDQLKVYDIGMQQDNLLSLGETRSQSHDSGASAPWFNFWHSDKDKNHPHGPPPASSRDNSLMSRLGRMTHMTSSSPQRDTPSHSQHVGGTNGDLDSQRHPRNASPQGVRFGDQSHHPDHSSPGAKFGDQSHHQRHSPQGARVGDHAQHQGHDPYSDYYDDVILPPPVDDPVDHYGQSFSFEQETSRGRPQRHGHEGRNTSTPVHSNSPSKPKAKSKARTTTHAFTIMLDKAHGDALGLEVQEDHAGGVMIQAVTGGLAGHWNAQNPESKVQSGDRIVEVNGTAEPHMMLQRCREEDILMVTVERAVSY